MAREDYNPNDLFDQFAALSEANMIKSMINGIEDKKTKMFMNALIKVLDKYGIKGFDAFRFVNEVAAVVSGIDAMNGDG